MPIVLLRVDERLIHGQVVVGWGGPLHVDRIVVADDEIAGSAWEQELYCLGIPVEMEAQFCTVGEARGRLPEWRESPARVMVLVRDVASLGELGRDGALRGDEVNLGGVHHGEGRIAVLPYLHLSEKDLAVLRELGTAGGVGVSARDLPATRAVPLEEILRAVP
jgi:mannose/fructose/N-acetylgalactosamine-specific phosphotransferase system component IIB